MELARRECQGRELKVNSSISMSLMKSFKRPYLLQAGVKPVRAQTPVNFKMASSPKTPQSILEVARLK